MILKGILENETWTSNVSVWGSFGNLRWNRKCTILAFQTQISKWFKKVHMQPQALSVESEKSLFNLSKVGPTRNTVASVFIFLCIELVHCGV